MLRKNKLVKFDRKLSNKFDRISKKQAYLFLLKKISMIRNARTGEVKIANSKDPQNPNEVFSPNFATPYKSKKAISNKMIPDVPIKKLIA